MSDSARRMKKPVGLGRNPIGRVSDDVEKQTAAGKDGIKQNWTNGCLSRWSKALHVLSTKLSPGAAGTS